MIEAAVLYNALAALRAVQAAGSSATMTVPLWVSVLNAGADLESSLKREYLQYAVAPPEDGDIPALP